MITYIKGTIEEKKENLIVIECGNIGYEVFVSNNSLQEIGTIGENIKLQIYLIHKEDLMVLYGFVSKEEKSLFEKLISVSGIGPKGALAILSSGKIESIVASIAQGNIVGLSHIKGIGKKTAERIIVELRDKVDYIGETFFGEYVDMSFIEDAVVALNSLGFKKKEAEDLINYAVKENAKSLEEVIQIALRKSIK